MKIQRIEGTWFLIEKGVLLDYISDELSCLDCPPERVDQCEHLGSNCVKHIDQHMIELLGTRKGPPGHRSKEELEAWVNARFHGTNSEAEK